MSCNLKNNFMRKIIFLVSFLAIAVFAAYLLYNPQIFSRQKNTSLIAGFNAEKINKIEIDYLNNKTVLAKLGDIWQVTTASSTAAKIEPIKQLIDALQNAQNNNIISQNKDKYSIFQVDQSGAIVKFYDGENLVADIVAGKMGSDYNSNYVRLNNSDIVYLIKSNIRYLVTMPDWRDLTVLKLDSSKIKKISLNYPKQKIELEKGEAGWNIISPASKAKDEEVNKIVGAVSSLTAMDVSVNIDAKETGLDKPTFSIDIVSDGDLKDTIFVGNKIKNKEEYYLRKNDKQNVFIVSKSVIDDIKKTLKDLTVK